MTNFVEILQRKQAQLVTKEAELPEALKANQFAKKEKKEPKEDNDKDDKNDADDKGGRDEYPKGYDKEAAQKEIGTFADTVVQLTEKIATIVRENHNTVAEQLFRNMVSSSMNMKLAGMTNEAFEDPKVLVKNAYTMMLNAADLLDLQLS